MDADINLWMATLRAEPLPFLGLVMVSLTGLYLGITAFFRSFRRRSARWFGLIALALGMASAIGGVASYLAHQSFVKGATDNLSATERAPAVLQGDQISMHLLVLGLFGAIAPLVFGALAYSLGNRKGLLQPKPTAAPKPVAAPPGPGAPPQGRL